MRHSFLTGIGSLLLLGACHPVAESPEKPAIPGAAQDAPWSGITPDEALRFTGTEPFWAGQVQGSTLTWQTPEDQAGTQITVQRFAGRNGLGFSGTLAGAPFELAVSQADCSDGMSDRRYPFTVTVKQGSQTLRGCGWSDAHPYTRVAQP